MKKSSVSSSLLSAVLFTIIIASCAKVSNPTGGPRDRTLPVVVQTEPAYGARNFKGKTIVITFDEYVTLNNINDKFMVSPPMKKKPKVFIRGKNVMIEFAENLRDSTTYTCYFQDAIRDLNEGNTIEDYQFVFSTGSILDSLSVTGNVYNAFNLETPEKTMVLLYRDLADSFVVKHLPDYITRVDLKGYFRINNVKAGSYRLYALKDADNSKNYNNPEEEFAFMDAPVEIDPLKNFIPVVKDTVKKKKPEIKVRDLRGPNERKEVKTPLDTIVKIGEFPLMLFAPQKTNHYLTSSGRPSKYLLNYTLSLPPDSMDFRLSIPESKPGAYFIEKNKDQDSIKIWITDSTLYNKGIIATYVDYPFTDTLGVTNYKRDTIQMRFMAPRPIRGARIKKNKYLLETNIKGSTLKPGQQIYFTSVTPFRKPDTSKLKFYTLVDSSKQRVTYNLIPDSSSSRKFYLNADLKEDSKYMLIIDSAAFGSIYDDNNDSTGYSFSVKKSDSYSSLTMSIKNCTERSIIQLLTNQEKIVGEKIMTSDGKIVFPLLDAGKYRIKVIYDLDGDGKWTTGDFKTGRQPEPVSYYPNEIDLKAGWVLDMDQDWDIGKKYIKEQKLKEKKTPKK
jgi:hypothetical protein